MNLPKLKKSNRRREYDLYSDKIRDAVVYNYLFGALTHRELDEKIMKLDETITGYQSMNILHFLGLTVEFKGIFSGYSIETAISELKSSSSDNYIEIINSLNRYFNINQEDFDAKEDHNLINRVNEILDKIIIQPEISLIRKDETAMPIMLALHIIGGFSANILLFLNSMSQMSASVLEAARIDGASELRTFWSIVLPSIWGTIVEMIVIAMAGLATNQANLQAMYGNEATNTMRTVGYHIFVSIFDGGAESEIKYAYCSAFGLLATVVVAPATIFSRYLMNKLGPTDR